MIEDEFLKDLYMFMRKRETPIERIPNLGFKQIDLFVMFKIVKDLGGYYQVTGQQQWKQVYNTLGGNPRSTSAATCTRRHYEKLLLPFECHLTGKQVNLVPRTPPKHFLYANYNKEQDDGQGPRKRRLLSVPLLQNPQMLQSDLREPVFPLTPYYAHQFHPSHAVLPPQMPSSSSVLMPHRPSPPKTLFPFPPSHQSPTDRSQEPLEQLRYLAEQYRTTSGLAEPLNLSVKAPWRDADSVPASSFAPPSSNKSPKFLNKPSPLYTPHRQRAGRDAASETQRGEAGDASYGHPGKPGEAYVIDLEATSGPSSPSYEGSAATAGTDAGGPGEARDGGPDVRAGLPFSHLLPRISRENGGKMEIEVPLSVFHNWLRQCGSSGAALGAKRPPTLPPREGGFEPGHRADADFYSGNPTFHVDPRPPSSDAEDLRSTRKDTPSPAPTAEPAGNRRAASQDHFAAYRHLLLAGILKSAASQDVHPSDVSKLFVPKPLSAWDAYDRGTEASGTSGNIDSAAASSARDGAAAPGARWGSHVGPSAGDSSNPSATSRLELTNEEVMKLRRIISSST
ncbi:AT-rich interaction domain 6 isoform X2 [Gasterosteus aculeatus]